MSRSTLSCLVIAPGDTLPYRPRDWEDTLVVVAAGKLLLIASSGRRERFARGAWLVLGDLACAGLACAGQAPVALLRIPRADGRNASPRRATRTLTRRRSAL